MPIKKNKNSKKSYPDLIRQQFEVPQPNLQWYTYFTEFIFEREENKKIKMHLFLLIDGCYNEILNFKASMKVINSSEVVKEVVNTLESRNIPERERPNLIIHSDRGTQFSSMKYFELTLGCSNRFRPSMSPMANPKHNPVMERFVQTKIFDRIQSIRIQTIQEHFEANLGKLDDPKQLNAVIKSFVTTYNRNFVTTYTQEKSTAKAQISAKSSQEVFEEGKEFLNEPKFNQAYSKHILDDDERRVEIEKYRNELVEVWTEIDQSLPDNVSFAQAKPFLVAKLRLIERKIDKQFELNTSTNENTQELMEGQKLNMVAIGQVSVSIELLREEVRALKKKPNNSRINKVQLRDPIYKDHYELFMIGAGSSQKRLRTLRTYQLRLIYTLLYHLGLRLNEIRLLTKKDLLYGMETGKFNIVHSKTKSVKIHALPPVGVDRLNELRPEIDIMFDIYEIQAVGGSKKYSDAVFQEAHFIRFINEDLKSSCKKFNITAKLSSHSFRVGYITKLLKTMSVQKVAEIVGHADVESTMAYQRYAIGKQELID
jgi:integrase/transposase InsO family protein